MVCRWKVGIVLRLEKVCDRARLGGVELDQVHDLESNKQTRTPIALGEFNWRTGTLLRLL